MVNAITIRELNPNILKIEKIDQNFEKRLILNFIRSSGTKIFIHIYPYWRCKLMREYLIGYARFIFS